MKKPKPTETGGEKDRSGPAFFDLNTDLKTSFDVKKGPSKSNVFVQEELSLHRLRSNRSNCHAPKPPPTAPESPGCSEPEGGALSRIRSQEMKQLPVSDDDTEAVLGPFSISFICCACALSPQTACPATAWGRA